MNDAAPTRSRGGIASAGEQRALGAYSENLKWQINYNRLHTSFREPPTEEHMGVDFKLTREEPQGKPNIAILHLSGWLDRDSETMLVDAVQQAKDSGCEYVLLDMAGTGTITSAGIRAIQRAYQIMMPKGQAHNLARLKLCSAPAQVYQVLSITGLLSNVPMYESADDAVESFGK